MSFFSFKDLNVQEVDDSILSHTKQAYIIKNIFERSVQGPFNCKSLTPYQFGGFCRTCLMKRALK